jgi:ABC-type uncharacterized transport system substrate-binding protein
MEQVGQQNKQKSGPVRWLLVVIALVSGCQTSPPADLPKEARVKVLVSGPSASDRRVVGALKRQFKNRLTIHELERNRRTDRRVLATLARNKQDIVITIGSGAAQLAHRFVDRPVYIAQTYHLPPGFHRHKNQRVVSVIPAPASVLSQFHLLDKRTKRLGVITGSGSQALVAELRRAAAGRGLQLVSREAKTDREFLYEAQRLSSQVDAYWLLPDERILSATAIRQFMRIAVKRGKPVIAFNPNLLKLGALLSVESNEGQVARKIKQLVIADHYGLQGKTTRVNYVRGIKIHISKLAADRLNLAIPASMRRYQYEK